MDRVHSAIIRIVDRNYSYQVVEMYENISAHIIRTYVAFREIIGTWDQAIILSSIMYSLV